MILWYLATMGYDKEVVGASFDFEAPKQRRDVVFLKRPKRRRGFAFIRRPSGGAGIDKEVRDKDK